MRPPEFFTYDSANEPEKLERVDSPENAEESRVDDELLVDAAAEALDDYISNDESTIKFARVFGMIRDQAWPEVLKGADLDETLDAICERLRRGLQDELSRDQHAFVNEDISRIIGKATRIGVASELRYLLERPKEELPEGTSRDTFKATSRLDSEYSVDFIELYSRRVEEELEFTQMDLVQVKTSERRVDDREVKDTLKKHTRFMADEAPIMIEKFRSVEATPAEVDALVEALGPAYAGRLQEIWLDALTSGAEDPAAEFKRLLEGYRKDVSGERAFVNAAKHVKRGFIASHTLEAPSYAEGETEELMRAFGTAFSKWKEEWLGSIKTTSTRTLEPIRIKETRSVVYPLDGTPVATPIGAVDRR